MLAITKRNLQLYFSNKSGVFFSLLGALIGFGLYIIFIQKSMQNTFSSLDNTKKILDFWIIGGTLAVTSMTTTWTGATRLVYDRQSNKIDDFRLTDTPEWAIQLGYFLSSAIIGFVMQVVTYLVMVSYFMWQDKLVVDSATLFPLLLVMVLSSLLGATLATVFVQLIKTIEVSERLSVIIGTASGFLVGVYLPIGQLPDFAQMLIKWTPSAYVASAYRHILVGNIWEGIQVQGYDVEEFLGIGLKLKEMTSFYQELLIISLVLGLTLISFVAFLWLKRQKKPRFSYQ